MTAPARDVAGLSKLDQKALATRRKILVEATRLFARQGYHSTTVAQISQAIGMTQGAFFHHFPSKEALLEAVVDRLERGMADYRDHMQAPVTGKTLRIMVRLMVEHYTAQPEATVCLAALATEFAGSGHPILDRIRRAYDTFVDPFARLLSTHPGIQAPREVAVAFIGAVQGVAIQGMLREGDPPLEALADSLIGLMQLPDVG